MLVQKSSEMLSCCQISKLIPRVLYIYIYICISVVCKYKKSHNDDFIRFRAYEKYSSDNFKQRLMSWVWSIISSISHGLHVSSLFFFSFYPLYVQYIFMFQWPKLPELMISLNDYAALGDSFMKPPTVIVCFIIIHLSVPL